MAQAANWLDGNALGGELLELFGQTSPTRLGDANRVVRPVRWVPIACTSVPARSCAVPRATPWPWC